MVILDDSDYDILSKFSWSITCDGYVRHSRYLKKENGRNVYKHMLMHRMIIVPSAGYYLDHKNGNKLDNRQENLRICTTSQNQMNAAKRSKKTTSKYKGVHWNTSSNRWIVQIRKSGKNVHVGCFSDEDAAALAYDKAAVENYGDFCRLNFPK